MKTSSVIILFLALHLSVYSKDTSRDYIVSVVEDRTSKYEPFSEPTGLAFDIYGNLLVCDLYHIIQVSISGEISTFASIVDEQGTTLSVLSRLAIGLSGEIYAIDEKFHSIYRVKSKDAYEIFISGDKECLVNGVRQKANLKNINGLAVNNKGEVYISVFDDYYGSELGNSRILKITQSRNITTVHSGRRGGYALACDYRDNVIYAASTFSNMVYKLVEGVGLVPVCGNGVPSDSDGESNIAGFNEPEGIAIDESGVIYIADTKNHSVRAIQNDFSVITIAGTRFEGDKLGRGDFARFTNPIGVCVSPGGHIYITEFGRPRVKVIKKVNAK